MNTTPERVRKIASHLSHLTDLDLQIFIDDAIAEVSDQNAPFKHKERLQRYLAAHYASINVPRPANEKVSDLSQAFNRAQGEGLNSTEYGQEYKRLLKRAKGGYLRVM